MMGKASHADSFHNALVAERGAEYGTGTAAGIPIDYSTTTPAAKAYGIFQVEGAAHSQGLSADNQCHLEPGT